jgi:hypothetical protein
MGAAGVLLSALLAVCLLAAYPPLFCGAGAGRAKNRLFVGRGEGRGVVSPAVDARAMDATFRARNVTRGVLASFQTRGAGVCGGVWDGSGGGGGGGWYEHAGDVLCRSAGKRITRAQNYVECQKVKGRCCNAWCG